MQDIWKTYMVPITISCVGLVLALILGVAPLMGSNDGAAAQQGAATQTAALSQALEDSQAAQLAEIAELRQLVSAQARTISDIENRLSNLDRGVTRTFWRSKENTDFVATITDANQRLSNLETQMNTLNAAVPRISARVQNLQVSEN